MTIALSAAIAALLVAETLHAEGVVLGRVADRESGHPIPGANVVLAGTHVGTSTGADGRFVINTASGSFTLRISHIGHLPDSRSITLGDGDTLRVNVLLAPAPIATQPITVTAMLGAPRESPVTFNDLEVRDLRERYSVQDVPVLLSELPSTTYYSESGTATGYTYLNIRGFDARRISVMVNGVPQNDPEDHNVYWLDMPDLPASLEEIQVQRGAGSAFYGPPAIGGSVNLVTRNIAAERALEVSGGVWQLQYKEVLRLGDVRSLRGAIRDPRPSLSDSERRVSRPRLGGLQELLPRRGAV